MSANTDHLLSVAASASQAKPDSTQMQSFIDTSTRAGTYAAIDAYLEQQLRPLRVPGAALAIINGDQVVHQRSFGRAQRDGAPATPRTPFAIGSLTKSFTALAVMQLVEAGKVELDAPAQRYLPWFHVADAQASAKLTVRHLLNQSSGLGTWSGWVPMADFDESPGAAEKHARALTSLKLARPVGSAFEYSNTNFDLLGLIIEVASGESYADYVQNHIFKPLQMRHSYTAPEQALQDGLALGHRYWFSYPVAEFHTAFPHGCLASGGLISTTEDLSHYLIAQINDGRYADSQVLSAAGINEMHRPAISAGKVMGLSLGQYGMGWFIDDRGSNRIVTHDGSVPDFWAYMAIVPEQKKAIVLLVNADHFMMKPVLDEVASGATALLAGAQLEPLRLAVVPWALRGLALIPLLQVLGVTATLLRLHRWRKHPKSRPSAGRKWVLHVGIPIVANLLITMAPVLSFAKRRRGFLFLFAPDYSWVALTSGTAAAVWMVARTWLTLRILSRRRSARG